MNDGGPRIDEVSYLDAERPDDGGLLTLRQGIARLSFLMLGTCFLYGIFWFAAFVRRFDPVARRADAGGAWRMWTLAVFYPVSAPLVFSWISAVEQRRGLPQPFPLLAVGLVYLPALIALNLFPSKWNALIVCLYLATFLLVQWRVNRMANRAMPSPGSAAGEISPVLLLPLAIILALFLAVFVMAPLLRAGLPEDFFVVLPTLLLVVYFFRVTEKYVQAAVLATVTTWVMNHVGRILRYDWHWKNQVSAIWSGMTEGRSQDALAEVVVFAVLAVLMCGVLRGRAIWKRRRSGR